jgi:hypothetical protein
LHPNSSQLKNVPRRKLRESLDQKSRFPLQIKRSSDLLNKVFFESLEEKKGRPEDRPS